ncbi:MAG: hypothetical protein IPI31_10075 [Bacteroidetes bacterium]|jgi:hypothetical protein|nr:hypothetical protein [Bacteroidota bacterium]MBK7568155.1 hypothetical protein [Bacteroidota bacterium]
MSNSENRTAPKKSYSISNDLMLKFIDGLPSLKDNNKNTEFILSAQTVDDIIISDKNNSDAKSAVGTKGTINIKFSYDFVNDRWFLNDNKISVVDRERG